MMKKFILSALIMLLVANCISAQKQGTIVYEQTINLHKSLSPEQQAYKAMIPETSTQKTQLVFNEEKACLRNLPADSAQSIEIKVGGSDKQTWFDLKQEVFREYIDVDDELYHTETAINMEGTKPTGKSKNILNYKCEEYKSNDDEFSFWVSKDLPKYLSPMIPLFFDGAILAIESDRLSYMAISFSKEIDAKELIPLDSKEITQEQFQDLEEEKMNEMETMGGKVMKMEN